MKIEDIKILIAEKSALLLYFYNDSCAPCKILRPKVQTMTEADFPRLEYFLMDAEQNPEISAHYGVFASPTLLVFFEGKEYIRESKNISVSELHDKIERYYNLIF